MIATVLVTPDQHRRPDFYEGLLTYDGKRYRFLSGGDGRIHKNGELSVSLPYGDYGPLIKPPGTSERSHQEILDDLRPIPVREIHQLLADRGAIYMADSVYDPKYQKNRDGKGVGFGFDGQTMYEEPWPTGCCHINRHDWPEFRDKINAAIDAGKKLYFHFKPDGATINEKE